MPPYRDLESTARQFALVRAACESAGRNPEELVYSHAITICCATEQSELERRAARIGRELDDLRQNGAAGTPDEVIARLAEYGQAGASRSYLQVIDLDDLDQIALVANEVLPGLAG